MKSTPRPIGVAFSVVRSVCTFVLVTAVLGVVGASLAAFLGLIPWLDLAVDFDGVEVPDAGMSAQLGLAAIGLVMIGLLPSNARVRLLAAVRTKTRNGRKEAKTTALTRSEDQYDANRSVFCTIAAFRAAHPDSRHAGVRRIVHCINPFPAEPGTEHDRAQRMTLRSMELARAYAGIARPDLTVAPAVVTAPGDPVPPLDGGWTDRVELVRDIGDVIPAHRGRALPLVHDIVTAVPLAPDDVFVFTNVDITLVPGFYTMVTDLFRRGVDAAIVNRRTISDIHSGPEDIDLALGEIGTQHPGFDCFAMRGSVRDRLIAYDGCVGVGGVNLPLTHQLLALADRPVVLLDAHVTYHFGDDRQWDHPRFRAIRDHNRAEIDRVFAELTRDPDQAARLHARLRGANANWVYPSRLREGPSA